MKSNGLDIRHVNTLVRLKLVCVEVFRSDYRFALETVEGVDLLNWNPVRVIPSTRLRYRKSKNFL